MAEATNGKSWETGVSDIENERKRQRRTLLLVFGTIGIMVVGIVAFAIVANEDAEPHSRH